MRSVRLNAVVSLMSLFVVSLCLTGCTPPADTGPEPDGSNTTSIQNDESTQYVKVSVPAMTCEGGCPPVVMDTLAKCPGVKSVEVNFEEKLATVAVNPSEYDAELAVNALVEVGFKGSESIQ